MELLDSFLRVRKSILPGAGKGLFTTIDIPAKTMIVEYGGDLVKWNDVKDFDGYNAYLFKINSRWAIDALHDHSNIARFANDARGIGRAIGMRNNCEYIVKGKNVYICSTRKIYSGGEIYVDYSRAYWSLINKVLKDPEYKKKLNAIKKNLKLKK